MKYSMVLEWSERDQAYLVFLPEWEGILNQPCGDGKTYEAAARSGAEILEMMLDVVRDEGVTPPAPASPRVDAFYADEPEDGEGDG